MSFSASALFGLGRPPKRPRAGRGRVEDGTAADAGAQARPGTGTRRLAVTSALVLGDLATYAGAYAILALSTDGIFGLERLLALIALGMILLYGSERLYPGYRLHHHEQLRRRSMATLGAGPVATLGAALLLDDWRPALTVAAFLSLALCAQPVVHRTVRRLLHDAGRWGESAAIIAPANQAPLVEAYFEKHWQYGIRPVPASAATNMRPDIALIAGEAIPPRDELAKMRAIYREIVLLADTPNMVISGLRPADLNGQIGLRLAQSGPANPRSVMRRLLDMAIAIPAAIVFAPVVLLAAAAILAVDPGPVFYSQTREGLRGRTIQVLKLRTMYRDAEQRLAALLSRDPAASAEWSAHFKLRNDPRILPIVGRFLRSTSLDELPQLYNVIVGDMGIVGPRPFPDYHLSAMKAEFRQKRCSVIPGLTGLWQISERSNADLDQQQQLDEFYIDNRSFWFDWHIIVSTIAVIIRRTGAY